MPAKTIRTGPDADLAGRQADQFARCALASDRDARLAPPGSPLKAISTAEAYTFRNCATALAVSFGLAMWIYDRPAA